MSRGVLYIVWEGSEPRTESALERSIHSLRQWHLELPYHVHRLREDSTLLDKAAMCDLTPFDETLFLDADTVVMDRLDYGFEKAAKHGMALCICECPWARRYPSCTGDQTEYNAGIIWFAKQAKPVFDRWQQLNRVIDSSIIFQNGKGLSRMDLNDQAGLTLAIESLDFNPWVLPMNWNFRPIWQKSFFGPIKIYHDYSNVPDELIEWNESQNSPGAIVGYAKSRQ